MKLADFPELAAADDAKKREVVDELLTVLGYPRLNELVAPYDLAELSDEVKSTLDNRWAEYEKNPESALTLEEVERRLKEKYG